MDVGAVLIDAAGEFIGYGALYFIGLFSVLFNEAVYLFLG